MGHKQGEKIQLGRKHKRRGAKPNVSGSLSLVLRLFRTSREVKEPSRLPLVEQAGFPVSHRCYYGRQVEKAFSEEERKRAYALMMGQKLHFIG